MHMYRLSRCVGVMWCFSRLLLVVSLALSTAVLSGCASNRQMTTGSVSAPYLLGPGDKIRVLVFGQADLSNSYSVNQSGEISMPLIGSVVAEGVTTDELEGQIRASLMNGYLRDPKVAVEIEEYRPFFVLGEVRTAGSFPWQEGLTAQKAVALAGGFSERASTRRVTVSRVIDGEVHQGRVGLDFAIQPGDTIEVQQRLF